MTCTSLLAALFTTISMAAHAAPCAERANILTYLATKFEETPIAMGLTSDGKVIEVLTSDEGSWTIIITMPTGITCALSFGESWSKPLNRNFGGSDTGS